MNEQALDVQQLVTADLFKDADFEFIEHLLQHCRIVELEAGDMVTIGAGELLTFYVVLEGELATAAGQQFLHGQSVGDENLFYRNPDSFVVEARRPTRLLAINEDDFWRMVSLDQQLVHNLAHGRLKKDIGAPLRLSMRNWTIAGAALVLLGVLAFGVMRLAEPDLTDGARASYQGTNTENSEGRHTVALRTVDDWVQIRGTVQPIRWTEVTAALNSQVTDMNFTFGDEVTRGDLLMQLNSAAQESQLRDAQAAAILAEQEFQRLQEWASGPEVRRAERERLRATDELEKAESEVVNAQRLFERGIISEKELENALHQRDNRRIEEINARESLQATLENGDETAVHLAKLQLENAREKLAIVESEVAAARITSPATGVIYPAQEDSGSKDDASPAVLTVGSPVQANQRLFAIADMQGLAMEADVAEIDMLMLESGQPAKVFIDVLPDLELAGEIEYVAGRGVSKDYQGTQFHVRVVVPELTDEQRRQVRLGMTASAQVMTYSNDRAVVIPFEAVRIENGQYSVQKWVNGEWQTTPVQVRSTRVDGIEISEGVQAGDELQLSRDSFYGG